jgi:hypothetical protein
MNYNDKKRKSSLFLFLICRSSLHRSRIFKSQIPDEKIVAPVYKHKSRRNKQNKEYSIVQKKNSRLSAKIAEYLFLIKKNQYLAKIPVFSKKSRFFTKNPGQKKKSRTAKKNPGKPGLIPDSGNPESSMKQANTPIKPVYTLLPPT